MASKSRLADLTGDEIPFELAVKWHIPDEMPLVYANHFVVQVSDGQLIVSAFETRKPLLLGDRARVAADVKKLKSIPAHCVSRLIMSPEKFVEFVNLLVRHRDRFIVTEDEDDPEERDDVEAE